jgi:hypothetical protein
MAAESLSSNYAMNSLGAYLIEDQRVSTKNFRLTEASCSSPGRFASVDKLRNTCCCERSDLVFNPDGPWERNAEVRSRVKLDEFCARAAH